MSWLQDWWYKIQDWNIQDTRKIQRESGGLSRNLECLHFSQSWFKPVIFQCEVRRQVLCSCAVCKFLLYFIIWWLFFLQRRMSPQRARTWFRPWAWLFPESIVGLATCCCSLPTNPAHSQPAQLLTALRSVSNEPNGHPCQLTQPQANKYALLKKRQRRKISERCSAGFTIPDW